MTTERGYQVSLQDLERQARVPLEDQVEVVETATPPPPDPRGAQPDRDWFAAGA
jgi:hypothetical protein